MVLVLLSLDSIRLLHALGSTCQVMAAFACMACASAMRHEAALCHGCAGTAEAL